MALAPWSRAKSTRRPLKNSIWMLPRCAVASFSICWRSSRLNSDFVFCGLRMTATITTSKWRAVRSMMSRWPRVTGSNEPGQRAVATQELQSARRLGSLDEEHERIAERALPAGSGPVGHRDSGAGGALDRDHGAGRQPARHTERLHDRGDCVIGRVV